MHLKLQAILWLDGSVRDYGIGRWRSVSTSSHRNVRFGLILPSHLEPGKTKIPQEMLVGSEHIVCRSVWRVDIGNPLCQLE